MSNDFDLEIFEKDLVPGDDNKTVIFVDEDPTIPGAETAIILDDDDDLSRETDWEHDKDHGKFLMYLRKRVDEMPRHSGETTVGCEKAISYLRRLDREISQAIRSDEDDVIDEQEAEALRDLVYDYIGRLEVARDKLMGKYRKSSSIQVGKKVIARIKDGVDIQYFISVAAPGEESRLLQVDVVEPSDEEVGKFMKGEGMQKEAALPKIMVFEDPFMHQITKMLINSHITHGRDMEEVYQDLNKKYSFTPREELSIQGLLESKGFPLIKDLGRLGEDDVQQHDGKGVEHSTRYYG